MATTTEPRIVTRGHFRAVSWDGRTWYAEYRGFFKWVRAANVGGYSSSRAAIAAAKRSIRL